jgi:hypothetical protein
LTGPLLTHEDRGVGLRFSTGMVCAPPWREYVVCSKN